MSATEKILKMSENEVKLKLISLMGSIHAVADSTTSREREYALHCLVENCSPLLQELHLDLMEFHNGDC